MNKVAIQVEHLTKVYQLYESHADRVKEAFHPRRKKYHRPFHALTDITLEIGKGDFVGIIGRNGSGKSTLLQLITGILQPTSGHIKVDGQISALLELGAGFNPDFTGRENVYLNGSILGISREHIERSFAAIETFADIGDFIDQPVKTYSSGMFVRLAFAIAIHVNPQILIVDEALAVGDMFFQQKCIRHMEEKMGHCTKVLVTHDMHAVANLCKRVFVLDQGRLVFTGSPLDGIEYYTKAIHNEMYRDRLQPLDVTNDKPHQMTQNLADGWVAVDFESIAGAGEVKISHVRLLDADKKTAVTATAGDTLHVEMHVSCQGELDRIIFGYTIKDRVGNGICGDNSLSLTGQQYQLVPGRFQISLTFNWPDIQPDEYLITLGIGQGSHPLNHIIQCWAHNVLLVKALGTGEVVHGIFTNPLLSCEIDHLDLPRGQ
jgi:ABC-type polysaccharide/polyol phosphate transport system ATPase subunit